MREDGERKKKQQTGCEKVGEVKIYLILFLQDNSLAGVMTNDFLCVTENKVPRWEPCAIL